MLDLLQLLSETLSEPVSPERARTPCVCGKQSVCCRYGVGMCSVTDLKKVLGMALLTWVLSGWHDSEVVDE